MPTIRPFEPTEADYEAFAALEAAVWPEYPDTVEEWKHRDQTRDPKYLFRRFVVEQEGQMVACGLYCEPWWSLKPGKYYFNISVHPDHRRRGIGGALYDHLMALLAEHDPATLVTQTREDQADALRFLANRGFEQQMRFPISHLNVAAFEPDRFAATVAGVQASGIEIRPLSEVASTEPDWKQKFWDLDWEILQDVPSPDPLTRLPFEAYEKQILGAPGFNLQAQFVALDGDRWVGLSGLWLPQDNPGVLYTGLTGVVRSHRRRGIATAMKVRAIGFARRHGAQIIETDNEENNPMYFLNLKLGFESRPAMLDMEKKIKEPPSPQGV